MSPDDLYALDDYSQRKLQEVRQKVNTHLRITQMDESQTIRAALNLLALVLTQGNDHQPTELLQAAVQEAVFKVNGE